MRDGVWDCFILVLKNRVLPLTFCVLQLIIMIMISSSSSVNSVSSDNSKNRKHNINPNTSDP